jgi:hypothetical protein
MCNDDNNDGIKQRLIEKYEDYNFQVKILSQFNNSLYVH